MVKIAWYLVFALGVGAGMWSHAAFYSEGEACPYCEQPVCLGDDAAHWVCLEKQSKTERPSKVGVGTAGTEFMEGQREALARLEAMKAQQ